MARETREQRLAREAEERETAAHNAEMQARWGALPEATRDEAACNWAKERMSWSVLGKCDRAHAEEDFRACANRFGLAYAVRTKGEEVIVASQVAAASDRFVKCVFMKDEKDGGGRRTAVDALRAAGAWEETMLDAVLRRAEDARSRSSSVMSDVEEDANGKAEVLSVKWAQAVICALTKYASGEAGQLLDYTDAALEERRKAREAKDTAARA